MTETESRTKAEWRQCLHARRAQLDPGWVAAASRSITREALALPELAGATTVAAYLALPDEPSLDALIEQLLDDGKTVCSPAYDDEHGCYRLCFLAGDTSPEATQAGRGLRPGRASSSKPGAVQGKLPRPARRSLETTLVVRRFGVREPLHPRWADACTPDVWLVPGVGFDRQGNRLGHGAGYYDRLLEGTTGIRAGIAFAFQVLDGIPAETHDVGMHMVITEQGTHRI